MKKICSKCKIAYKALQQNIPCNKGQFPKDCPLNTEFRLAWIERG